jgi:hypothetical protein
MKLSKILAIALSSLFITCAASADPIVFQNGELSGQNTGAQIYVDPDTGPQAVSDSFSLSDQTKLSQVILGLWTSFAGEPATLMWSIGTSAFANDRGTGTAALSNELVYSYPDGDSKVYRSTFGLDVTLDAGSYWLTLSNATSTDPSDGFVGWDINGGPSQAYYLNNSGTGTLDSEFFALQGTVVETGPVTSPVPEPASLAIFAAGLMGMGALRRRQNRGM